MIDKCIDARMLQPINANQLLSFAYPAMSAEALVREWHDLVMRHVFAAYRMRLEYMCGYDDVGAEYRGCMMRVISRIPAFNAFRGDPWYGEQNACFDRDDRAGAFSPSSLPFAEISNRVVAHLLRKSAFITTTFVPLSPVIVKRHA